MTQPLVDRNDTRQTEEDVAFMKDLPNIRLKSRSALPQSRKAKKLKEETS